jgi:hypothetical protein
LYFVELGLPKSSSADRQQLHTVSATCSYTATFITVPAKKRIHLFRGISGRYQLLTLYSPEYDC